MQYKWWVFTVTSVAILMAAIDSTVVLLAIYPIAASLDSDFVTIVWVVMAYLLVTTTFGLTLGRLGDLFGRKLMFNTGFAVFTAGSLFCGISQTGVELVLFRAVQGFGAALIMSNSFAILSEVFEPRERGKAFGFNAIVWSGGSIAGIALGGLIIGLWNDWRLIFFINIPIGIFGTYWAYRTIRPAPRAEGPRPRPYFDLPGAVTFTAGILLLLVGVTSGLLYGWREWYTLTMLATAPVAFLAFIVWEARFSKDPLFHREFFRNAVFTTSITAAFLQSLAIFSVNFLLLFYFEGVAGVPVLTASLLVIPMAFASSLAGPFGGTLSDRIGPKTIASAGLIVQASVLFLFSRITTGTPLLYVGIMEAAYGVGGGLFWPANTATIMSASPPGKFGVGSGIMNTFRNTGMILSFAVSLTAITAMVPSYVVYTLFVGNTKGALPQALASSYLSGQAFAFEISLVLLFVALGLVLWKAPGRKAALAARHWTPAPGGPRPEGGGAAWNAPRGAAEPATVAAATPPPSYSGSSK